MGEFVAGKKVNTTDRENPSNKKVSRWENARGKVGVKTQDMQPPQFVPSVPSQGYFGNNDPTQISPRLNATVT
jgi:hypothetical protein